MPTRNGPVIRATGGGSTNATTVTITDNESTAENNVIVFVADAAASGGDVGLESDGDLNYNPNTGLLTSTGFAGATVDATTDFTVGSTVITDDVVTFTPSTGDTVTMTSATNGAFSLVTVDTDAAAANIQITADGTVDIDSAGAMTLDSGAAINIDPAAGSAILLDGTISIDAGVVTGATSITSTDFAGALTGNADTVTTNADLTGHITSTGNAAVLGSFTSAQLSTALTNETGSGSAVFATSPTLVTPALGTPTALVLTSATGLPAAGVVGTAVTLADTQTLTNKRITKRTGTVTSHATPTINTDNVDYYSVTALAAAITSMTTNLSGTPVDAQTLWLSFTDDGTARAIAWGASFEASTTALPTTTVISARLDVGFVWNTVTSKWRCLAAA